MQRLINFKIGTYLQECSRSHDPIFVKVGQRSRSYRHIMYEGKMCHNSITGGQMNFILGSQNEDDLPTSAAQNGCHSNDGCLATGPLNLHLII